jgi:hypothetical protein
LCQLPKERLQADEMTSFHSHSHPTLSNSFQRVPSYSQSIWHKDKQNILSPSNKYTIIIRLGHKCLGDFAQIFIRKLGGKEQK